MPDDEQQNQEEEEEEVENEICPVPELEEDTTTGEDPDNRVLDEAMVYSVLKHNKGSLEGSLRMLRKAGYQIYRPRLERIIEGNPILRAHFGEGSLIVHNKDMDGEAALLRLPNDELDQGQMARVIERQDEYIAARGLEGIGFSSEDIREMESMTQFVGHGFRKTIDLTHGVMVTQLWKLKKRAEYIESILVDDTEEERLHIDDKGRIVRYTGKRYTDTEKLEWQKEYTNIVDLIRRISDSSNQSAAVRLKAQSMANDSERKSRPKKKKLKRV